MLVEWLATRFTKRLLPFVTWNQNKTETTPNGLEFPCKQRTIHRVTIWRRGRVGIQSVTALLTARLVISTDFQRRRGSVWQVLANSKSVQNKVLFWKYQTPRCMSFVHTPSQGNTRHLGKHQNNRCELWHKRFCLSQGAFMLDFAIYSGMSDDTWFPGLQ